MASRDTNRLDAAVAAFDSAAGAALDGCRRRDAADVRIEVTGRAGVGRSALVAALGPMAGADVVETDAWDRPGATDPELRGDVVVLAVLDPPRVADRAAASAAGDRLLPVLVKADTVADPDGAAARTSSTFGRPCLPVSTVGEGSGVGAVREALADRIAAVRADRAAALLAHVRSLRAHPPLLDPVEEFLASDDGVALAARATGMPVTPADPLARARHWRRRIVGDVDASGVRAALAMNREAAREWARRA